MKRKTGEQLLRDFAAEDARDMRRYARQSQDSGFAKAMEAYHRGRYNSYKTAINVVNVKHLWRDE